MAEQVQGPDGAGWEVVADVVRDAGGPDAAKYAAGAASGAAAGGAIGSVIPGIGTAIGSAVGAVVGAVAAAWDDLVEWVEGFGAAGKRRVRTYDMGTVVLRREGWSTAPNGLERRFWEARWNPRAAVTVGEFLWLLRRTHELGGGRRELERVAALGGVAVPRREPTEADARENATTYAARLAALGVPASARAPMAAYLGARAAGWDAVGAERRVYGRTSSGAAVRLAGLRAILTRFEQKAPKMKINSNVLASRRASAYFRPRVLAASGTYEVPSLGTPVLVVGALVAAALIYRRRR